MKSYMADHVEDARHTMFKDSADHVRDRLKRLFQDVKVELVESVDDIFVAVRRDYHTVIGRGDAPQGGHSLPKAQRMARRDVATVIQGVETRFKRVAGHLTLEEEEALTKQDISEETDGPKAEDQEKAQDGPTDQEMPRDIIEPTLKPETIDTAPIVSDAEPMQVISDETPLEVSQHAEAVEYVFDTAPTDFVPDRASIELVLDTAPMEVVPDKAPDEVTVEDMYSSSPVNVPNDFAITDATSTGLTF